jgi:hypothetical protein
MIAASERSDRSTSPAEPTPVVVLDTRELRALARPVGALDGVPP